jgi:hypothetical protein
MVGKLSKGCLKVASFCQVEVTLLFGLIVIVYVVESFWGLKECLKNLNSVERNRITKKLLEL